MFPSSSGWIPLASFINSSANTSLGYLENFTNAKRILGYGFNSPWYKLKSYPSGWAGNQYVSTFNVTKAAKLTGTISFGLGTAIDAYGVYTFYTQGSESPNAVHPAKASANLGVGLYGLYGEPPGWIVGGLYFLDDATGTSKKYSEWYSNELTKKGKPAGYAPVTPY